MPATVTEPKLSIHTRMKNISKIRGDVEAKYGNDEKAEAKKLADLQEKVAAATKAFQDHEAMMARNATWRHKALEMVVKEYQDLHAQLPEAESEVVAADFSDDLELQRPPALTRAQVDGLIVSVTTPLTGHAMDSAMDTLRAEGKEDIVKVLADLITTYQNLASAGIAAGMGAGPSAPSAMPGNAALSEKPPVEAPLLPQQPGGSAEPGTGTKREAPVVEEVDKGLDESHAAQRRKEAMAMESAAEALALNNAKA